jgi:hypothetical protein
MKPFTRTLAALAVPALCLALVATDAHAQFGGMGGGMRRGGGGSRQKDATSNQQAGPSIADRLYQARTRLLITNAQTPAWEHFYTAIMTLQQPMRHSVAMSDANSAQQTMQQVLSQAQDRYTLAETAADALKQLYAQLDAQQKATADELLPGIISDAARPPGGRERGNPG